MKRPITYLLGCLAAAPAVAAGFDSEAASTVGGPVTVTACNGIAGTAGLIQDWTHTKPSSKSLKSTTGRVGGRFNGTSEQHCDLLTTPVTATTTCRHVYKRNGGSADFQISLQTADLHDGQATWVDGGTDWWWLPQIDVRDTKPTVTLLKADGSIYSTVGWTETDPFEVLWRVGTGGLAPPGGTQTPGAAAGSTGGGTPPAGVQGSMAATTGTIAENPNVKKVQIDYTTQSTVNRTADNAIVTDWYVVIESTMETSAN